MKPLLESIGNQEKENAIGRPSLDSITNTVYDIGILDRDDRIQKFMSNTQDLNIESKSKLVNSLYLADAYNVPFEQAYQNHDGAMRELFNRKISASEAMAKIRSMSQTNEERFNDYDDGYYNKARATGAGKIKSGIFSFLSKAKDRYNKMGVDMTKNLAGVVEATGDITFSKTLQNWSEMMRDGVKMYMEEHPEQFLNPGGKGFWDTTWGYVSNPEYIALGVMEQVPNIALSYLGSAVGGAAIGALGKGAGAVSKAKWIGGVEGFAVPSFGRRYSDLRGDGVSPMVALPEAFLGSQAEGLLEQWTLGKKIQIFKNAGKSVQRAMSTNVSRALLGGAKTYGRGAIEEGSQQISDNFLAIIFRDVDVGLLNDVGNNMAAGGILEAVMSGAFHTAGLYSRQVDKTEKLRRLDALKEKISQIPLNETARQEIVEEIDAMKAHVESQSVIVGEAKIPQTSEDAKVIEEKVEDEIESTQRYGLQEVDGGWAVKDWETENIVSKHTTDREALAEVNKLNYPKMEQAGGIISEQLKWKRASGETVEITRGELGAELTRLGVDLDKRLSGNNITTKEGVEQAEADWKDIQSMSEALGYAKSAKPFKVVRTKKKGTLSEIKVLKNPKARIWASIKGVKEPTITVGEALRNVMKGMSKASSKAFMEGARKNIALHKNINQYARKELSGLNISKQEMSRIMTAISTAKSDAQMVAAHALIDIIADKAKHAKSVATLKKTIAFINRKNGKTRTEGGIAPDYFAKIKEVTDSFVITSLRPKQKQRLKSLSSYLSTLKTGESQTFLEAYTESRIPKELLAQVETMDVTSLEDMTAKEIDKINQTLRHLIHLNNIKNSLINNRTGEKIADGLNEAVKEVSAIKDKSTLLDKEYVDLSDKPDKATNFADMLKQIKTSPLSYLFGNKNHDIDTLSETLSGGIHGSIFDILANGFSDGRTQSSKFNREWNKIANEYFGDIKIEELQDLSDIFFQLVKNPVIRKSIADKVNLKETPLYNTFKDKSGKVVRMTMAQMMSVYMMTENIDTVHEMIKAGVASTGQKLGPIEIQDILNIRKQVESNSMAMKLIEFGKKIKRFEASKINETSRELDGIDIAVIDDYWHRERFTGGGVAGHQTYRNSLLEAMGWLKEREGSGNPVIIRDFFETITSDSSAISEYVGMAKYYRNMKNLLNYKEFRDTAQVKGYAEELKLIDTLVERAEQKPKDSGPLSNVVSKMLSGLTVSVLANPGIMAGQISSLLPVFENELSLKYASAITFSDNKLYMERLKNIWAIYNDRVTGHVSSIALKEVGESDIALRKFTGKSDYMNYLTRGIGAMDTVAITQIARMVEAEMADSSMSGISAQYWMEKGIDPSSLEKDSPEYLDAFEKRANYVLRRTQPMFFTENRSVLTSETSAAVKSFFLFRSYIDQPIRQAGRAINDYNNGRINAFTAAKRMTAIWAGLASYEIIRAAIRKGLFGSDEDEQDLLLSIFTAPIKTFNLIGYPAQKMLTETIDFKMTGDPIDLRYIELAPLPLQFANDAIVNVGKLSKAMGYYGSNERFASGKNKGKLKSEVYLYDGVYGIFSDTLKYYGVPINQIEKLAPKEEEKPKGIF